MQHGLADYDVANNMLRAINATNAVPLVRVPWNEPILIMRMLDAGALGIIAPMINNRSETIEFINACKYPPIGNRSYGPIRASLILGRDYVPNANNEVLAFAMIETKEALDNLEEIANVKGLNGFYIGTMDLSISLGLENLGALHDPNLMSAIKRIISIAKENDLMVGIHSKSQKETSKLQNLGVTIITPFKDSQALESKAQQVFEETKKTILDNEN